MNKPFYPSILSFLPSEYFHTLLNLTYKVDNDKTIL